MALKYRLNPLNMTALISDLRLQRTRVQSMITAIARIKNGLDMEIAATSGIKGQMDSLRKRLQKQTEELERTEGLLKAFVDESVATDQRHAKDGKEVAALIGGASLSAVGAAATSWAALSIAGMSFGMSEQLRGLVSGAGSGSGISLNGVDLSSLATATKKSLPDAIKYASKDVKSGMSTFSTLTKLFNVNNPIKPIKDVVDFIEDPTGYIADETVKAYIPGYKYVKAYKGGDKLGNQLAVAGGQAWGDVLQKMGYDEAAQFAYDYSDNAQKGTLENLGDIGNMAVFHIKRTANKYLPEPVADLTETVVDGTKDFFGFLSNYGQEVLAAPKNIVDDCVDGLKNVGKAIKNLFW